MKTPLLVLVACVLPAALAASPTTPTRGELCKPAAAASETECTRQDPERRIWSITRLKAYPTCQRTGNDRDRCLTEDLNIGEVTTYADKACTKPIRTVKVAAKSCKP